MPETIITFFTILLLTMLKFIAGPTLGYAAGYHYLLSVFVTVAGMMCSVLLFTFLGRILREKVIKKYFSSGKTFTKRSRRFVRIWQKYGEIGVAILTPLLLTPIGGTIMLSSTGTKKSKIVLYMLLSAVFWGFIITAIIYLFGDNVLKKYFNFSLPHLGAFLYHG